MRKEDFQVFQDFPTEGVSFVDVNSVLIDDDKRSELNFHLKSSLLLNFPLSKVKVNKLIAIESRGFIFGESLATALGAGLVLARKANKLPGLVISSSYGTEYSEDSLSIQVSAIEQGDNVVIHDDILATGGTALAVATLVEKLGGNVIGYSFIGDIAGLNGSEKLGKVPKALLYTF